MAQSLEDFKANPDEVGTGILAGSQVLRILAHGP
ncbi:MAG: hypothetical protein CM15mV63_370 [uncultured marine virus]|nr:MAG: hypothetical protein CM15mV63_370 [uncultured marine virus]